MHIKSKMISSGGVELGTIDFPVFDTIEEMIERLGVDGATKLCQRALNIDLERVARDAMKGDKPKTVKEAQALVDGYKVGGRGGKPTLKNFLALLDEFGMAEKYELMLKGQKLYKEDSLEAAHAFLTEQKVAGALAD